MISNYFLPAVYQSITLRLVIEGHLLHSFFSWLRTMQLLVFSYFFFSCQIIKMILGYFALRQPTYFSLQAKYSYTCLPDNTQSCMIRTLHVQPMHASSSSLTIYSGVSTFSPMETRRHVARQSLFSTKKFFRQ